MCLLALTPILEVDYKPPLLEQSAQLDIQADNILTVRLTFIKQELDNMFIWHYEE
jgi:hypothetical protein